MNECEKRGLSIVEECQLNQESIAELLWLKVQKAEQVFAAAVKTEERKKSIGEIAEGGVDAMELVDIPLPFSCPARIKEKKLRRIVGFAATRLDDSRKKWRVEQVVMGGDGLSTS